ncbi:hypothetical protein SERLADRAFT_472173 [Serpula lacrymans var. lacrymans S7.9]|nr:uncharacterized protein SERLADRAFT_472173 [Serpula lacrymans var. lacrymans S7.9]EGO23264.1 hypothetical protein SERLADRAFT_472173 [Serpula lacrymans var. lacrymans S7.9]
MQMDPRRSVHMSGKTIAIPQPSYRLGKMLDACQKAHIEEEYDTEDLAILNGAADKESTPEKTEEVDWVHDSEWVQTSMMHLMPPPSESSLSSTMALQKELQAMLKEQEKATRLSELGWYMSPELNGGNLFQWIVELHSFDPDLPVAKDMKAKGLNSLVFEIRFLPTFPISPPFFRIVLPRLLPFINGGGGHVTGGGSICMDLLTADGWLPSYSISAVLLQIKLAISNPDPRPARLDSKWDAPYSPQEALAGYTRAAATHGWKIPTGIEQVMR